MNGKRKNNAVPAKKRYMRSFLTIFLADFFSFIHPYEEVVCHFLISAS